MLKRLIPVLGLMPAVLAWPASYYTVRLEDPKAVYLMPEAFPVRGDGVADDTDGIQQAIDKVQETTNEGIVFIPEGRYRLTHTVYVWPGIRVIGYGAVRPVFLLGEKTPGYQDKDNESQMLFFAGGRPGAGRGRGAPDGAGGRGGRGGRGGQPPAHASGTGGRGGDGQPRDAGAGTV